MQKEDIELLLKKVRVLENRLDRLERENQELQIDLNELKAVTKSNSYDIAYLKATERFGLD